MYTALPAIPLSPELFNAFPVLGTFFRRKRLHVIWQSHQPHPDWQSKDKTEGYV